MIFVTVVVGIASIGNRALADPSLVDRAVEEKLRGDAGEERRDRFGRERQPALVTPASARTAGPTDGSGRFA